MSSSKGKRIKRFVIPVAEDEIELIEGAARLAGLKRTTFARRILLKRAQAYFDKQQANPRQLSPAAWDAFCASLEAPAQPNAALRHAWQRGGTVKLSATSSNPSA